MREWEKNIRRVTPYVAGEQPDRNKSYKRNRTGERSGNCHETLC